MDSFSTVAKITVNVVFFAVARELAGTGRSELSLEPGSTTQTLPQSLAERFPQLSSYDNARSTSRFMLTIFGAQSLSPNGTPNYGNRNSR
jgi:molybdopterin converting factor small subunit